MHRHIGLANARHLDIVIGNCMGWRLNPSESGIGPRARATCGCVAPSDPQKTRKIFPRVSVPARGVRNLLLLLVEGLGVFLFPHHGILPRHPSVERPLELGTQGQLRHVLGLLLAQYHALLHESLVLHAVEALFDVGDLERDAVGGADGRSYRGCDAVGAIAEGGAGLRRKTEIRD